MLTEKTLPHLLSLFLPVHLSPSLCISPPCPTAPPASCYKPVKKETAGRVQKDKIFFAVHSGWNSKADSIRQCFNQGKGKQCERERAEKRNKQRGARALLSSVLACFCYNDGMHAASIISFLSFSCLGSLPTPFLLFFYIVHRHRSQTLLPAGLLLVVVELAVAGRTWCKARRVLGGWRGQQRCLSTRRSRMESKPTPPPLHRPPASCTASLYFPPQLVTSRSAFDPSANRLQPRLIQPIPRVGSAAACNLFRVATLASSPPSMHLPCFQMLECATCLKYFSPSFYPSL